MLKRLVKVGLLLVVTFLFYTYTKSTGGYFRQEPELIEKPVGSAAQGSTYQERINEHLTEDKFNTAKVLEEKLESNLFDGFRFEESEKAICFYERYISEPFDAYTFQVYKEANDKDICYMGSICIKDSTKEIYIKTEEWSFLKEGKLSDENLLDDLEVSEVLVQKIKTGEDEIQKTGDIYIKKEDWIGISSYYTYTAFLDESKTNEILERKQSIVSGGEEVYERLDKAMDFFIEKKYKNLNITYGGSYLFLGKEYYLVSRVRKTRVPMQKIQDYFIDVQTQNVYEKSDDYLGVRTELYYIGNLDDVK